MRIRTAFTLALLLAAATTGVQAEPKTESGKPPACKAPSGEYFGLGETIDLPVTDGKGNIVKETYQCTDNGWIKVSKAIQGGGRLIHLAPSMVMRAL
jgi:hypothetical protein